MKRNFSDTQSLTTAIERPSRYVSIESFQRGPRLRKATVDTPLDLIENERKTIEISHYGVDLLQSYENLDIEEIDTES